MSEIDTPDIPMTDLSLEVEDAEQRGVAVVPYRNNNVSLDDFNRDPQARDLFNQEFPELANSMIQFGNLLVDAVDGDFSTDRAALAVGMAHVQTSLMFQGIGGQLRVQQPLERVQVSAMDAAARAEIIRDRNPRLSQEEAEDIVASMFEAPDLGSNLAPVRVVVNNPLFAIGAPLSEDETFVLGMKAESMALSLDVNRDRVTSIRKEFALSLRNTQYPVYNVLCHKNTRRAANGAITHTNARMNPLPPNTIVPLLNAVLPAFGREGMQNLKGFIEEVQTNPAAGINLSRAATVSARTYRDQPLISSCFNAIAHAPQAVATSNSDNHIRRVVNAHGSVKVYEAYLELSNNLMITSTLPRNHPERNALETIIANVQELPGNDNTCVYRMAELFLAQGYGVSVDIFQKELQLGSVFHWIHNHSPYLLFTLGHPATWLKWNGDCVRFVINEFTSRHPEFAAAFGEKLDPLKNIIDAFLHQNLSEDTMHQPLVMPDRTVVPSLYARELANGLTNTIDEFLTQLSLRWPA